MRNFVITIGRQTGSGGREIAERLARRLGDWVPMLPLKLLTLFL